MQAFIDTVRLRSGVFYPGDKDGRLRERGGELGDERDRPAHSHIDRIGTPRLPKRRPRRIIDRAARLDGVGLSDLAARDSDLGAPGGVPPQMGLHRVQVRRGIALQAPPEY